MDDDNNNQTITTEAKVYMTLSRTFHPQLLLEDLH